MEDELGRCWVSLKIDPCWGNRVPSEPDSEPESDSDSEASVVRRRQGGGSPPRHRDTRLRTLRSRCRGRPAAHCPAQSCSGQAQGAHPCTPARRSEAVLRRKAPPSPCGCYRTAIPGGSNCRGGDPPPCRRPQRHLRVARDALPTVRPSVVNLSMRVVELALRPRLSAAAAVAAITIELNSAANLGHCYIDRAQLNS